MIAQIVTLTGVLIGALATFLATSMAERTRHRRSMSTRWDERKLDTCIEYATCVKEISSTVKRARQAYGTDEGREFLSAMETAELRRSVLFETLVLLTSPGVVNAANEVNRALWQQLDAARTGDHAPAEVDLVGLLNRYHEQARADLGVLRSV
ncbi:hypothetical protein [Streptomyces sp. SID14478]|uniref:hypothetical protein n=1 Tax=Streptomyces sp. SID14478 TaxID=2706073 RepID=UPI001EF3A8E6|nr:hypothetical protein [Streptomyces sp. SID14478]